MLDIIASLEWLEDRCMMVNIEGFPEISPWNMKRLLGEIYRRVKNVRGLLAMTMTPTEVMRFLVSTTDRE